VLQVINVTKRFGGLVANNKMNLTVRAGEILALIGPNGAGKSTLFNCISGVGPATEGEIRFMGQRIEQLGSRAIAKLGMSRSFQHVRLNRDMTVLENAAIGAHLRGRKNFVQSAWRLDREEERTPALGSRAPVAALRPWRAPVRYRRQPAAGQAAHGRDRPRPVQRSGAAAARRTGRRPASSREARPGRPARASCAARAWPSCWSNTTWTSSWAWPTGCW
jgi:ABC-type sugar transport system ATPase subunit